MTFAPGENVGPYRIFEQLGQGGMATVFKAYHAGLDRYVAIKILHPAFKADPNFLGRFEREARIVAKLDHPNIIPVYDFAEHENTPYIVIRYVEGSTLKSLLREGLLPMDRVLSILRPVTSALAYAHTQGVLHRDIKPSNIMLTNDGHIYLSDFGLAKMVDVRGSTLSQDMLIGTPQYISPEQAKGEPIDTRSDLYSLGVVLFEMLTGRVPFGADTPYAIIHDHIFSPLPPPRSINPALSKSVEQVLLKSLAKNPNDRYFTATELMEALEQAVRGGSTVSKRLFRSSRPSLARAAPWGIVSAVTLVLLIVGIILFGINQLSGGSLPAFLASEQSPTPTITAAPTATPLPLPSSTIIAVSNIAPSAISTATVSPVPTHTSTPLPLATHTPTLPPPATNTRVPPPPSATPTASTAPDMVLVPAGAFWMGKNDKDAGAAADESPGHSVDLSAYFIDKFEVSNVQYQKCVDAGACRPPFGVFSIQSPHMAYGNPAFDDYPVVFVSHGFATQYCVWAGKRLPTEAEWEKAARGAADERIYPWGNLWDGYRANAAQGQLGPQPVRSYSPEGCSPFGACNMSGNVAEWVADYYHSTFYADSPRNLPGSTLLHDPIDWNTDSGKLVVRGGSFRSTIFDARVSKRGNQTGTMALDDVGFRCAMSVK